MFIDKMIKRIYDLRLILSFCFMLSVAFTNFGFCDDAIRLSEDLDFSSGPRLLYPVTENIRLGGVNQIEFKWERTNSLKVSYYDFKIYKGYDIIASNLILTKRISFSDYPVRLEAALFEIGQVYSWAVVSIFDNGEKSDKSFSSFKIIEK